MAVTQNSFTGNGSTTVYNYTFPYLKQSEVKASLDGTATTAFTHPSATSIQFNTAPGSGVKIKIFRETDSDSLAATFYAGSAIKSEDLNDNFTQNLYATQEVAARYLSNLGGTMTGDLNLGEDVVVKFEGATDNTYETTLTVADPTADRTITLPNITGTVITTGDTGTVATGMIAADAINGTKIADDAVDSEHIAADSLDTEHYAPNSVDTTALAADAVTGAQIADNAINSEHYTDGSIDREHLAADIVDGTKIADDSIDSEHYAADSIDSEHYAPNSVDADALAHTSVTAGTYTATDLTVDAQGRITAASSGSIATSEIADDAITSAKIADNAVTTDHIADAELTELATMSSGTASALADLTQTEVQVLDGVTATTAELNILDGVTATTAELNKTDGLTATPVELNTLDGVTSNTSELNKLDGYTGSTNDLNIVSGKSFKTSSGTLDTTSDTEIPSSKVIAAHVASSQTAIGGFITIADEVSFPATASFPANGVVVSINNAAGVVVNGSGVSTTGRTTDGTPATVTINNFPSSLNGETLAAGVGLMVTATSTSNTYNYHKILAAETDVKQLSDDINDFNARYRVASSAPGSSNDAGDMYFDTSANKMKVYNGTTSAWDDVASVGNFYINTLSSSSGTGGGSATFNNSAYRFTLSNAPTMAQQLIVSVNGVIQKPNAGTSQPSEGFAISGNDIVFSAAPTTGSDYFIVTQGSSVSIGTPSDNTVTSAKIVDGTIVNGDISSTANIAGSKIADDSIAEVKLDVHNAPATDKYLKYTSNGMEWSDGASEGTDVKSTGESGTTKFLRTDGDGTSSWQVPPSYTHPNHSGEVTSSADGAQTIASNVVDEDNLKVDNSPTNDHVLTAKSSAAGGLTWAAIPASGNSVDLVADGAIAAGKAVIIKSNGKAEQVGESLTATNTAVATSATTLGNIGFSPTQSSNASAYDPVSDLMAYAFRDSSDNLKVRLYSTSGTGFSQEAETTVDTSAANNSWGIGVLSGKRFAVVYRDDTRTRIRILPVNSSNDGFDSLGSETNLDGQSNGNTYRDVYITETTTNRVVVLTKGGNSQSRFDDKIGIIIGDVSGTTWTYRNSAQIGTDTPDEFWSIDYDSTNGVLGVTYDMSNGNCKMVGVKVAAGDGAAVTAGTVVTLQSSGAQGANQIRYHANAGSWITSWTNHTGGDTVKIKAHTINSSTLAITSGTEATHSGQGNPHYALDINISDQHHIYITWVGDNKYAQTVSATVSGTTLTVNSSDVTTNLLSNYGSCIERLGTHYMSHNNKLAHFGKADGACSDSNIYGTATIVTVAGNFSSQHKNFLGFAEDAISDGATGTIKLEGNVVGNQSGLTAGTQYHVEDDGTLDANWDTTDVGLLAISATSGIIRRGVN